MSDVADAQSDILNIIAEKCKEQEELDSRREALRQELEALDDEYNTLTMTTLPELFDSLGTLELVMQGGFHVKVEDYYKCGNLTKEEGLQWITEQGEEDLIKDTISCKFTRGEHELAGKALDLLTEQGFDPDRQEVVHHQTLKSAVKRWSESGMDVPYEKLGVFPMRRTVIKR